MPPGINSRYEHFNDAVEVLREIKSSYSFEDFIKEIIDKKNYVLRDRVEHNFEKAVISLTDIANFLITENRWSKLQSRKDIFDILAEHNLVKEQDVEIFKEFVRQRNIITHEYAVVDYKKIRNLLEYIDKLVECMEKILSQLNLTEI